MGCATHFRVAHGPNVDHMRTKIEDALAAEVRAEIARKGLTRTEVAARAGVNPRTWSRYFASGNRDVPLQVLISACAALDVSVSEMFARAEASLPADYDPFLDLMSGGARGVVSEERPRSPES